jgi:hypothetical protein
VLRLYYNFAAREPERSCMQRLLVKPTNVILSSQADTVNTRSNLF